MAHLDIRHEMPFPTARGRPKQVDLWLRPVDSGYAHCIEAGDFAVGKAHGDARKLQALNPRGANWFLAFFRQRPEAASPFATIQSSYGRRNGLNRHLITADERLTGSFQVYRPNGNHDPFGFALLKVAAPAPAGAPQPPTRDVGGEDEQQVRNGPLI